MKRIIRIKLLDDKYVEIRGYEMGGDIKVIHCINPDYKSCVHTGEDFQVITKAKQKKGKVINTQRSKFYPFDYYKMYSFLWKPTGKIDDKKYEFIGDKAIQI